MGKFLIYCKGRGPVPASTTQHRVSTGVTSRCRIGRLSSLRPLSSATMPMLWSRSSTAPQILHSWMRIARVFDTLLLHLLHSTEVLYGSASTILFALYCNICLNVPQLESIICLARQWLLFMLFNLNFSRNITSYLADAKALVPCSRTEDCQCDCHLNHRHSS